MTDRFRIDTVSSDFGVTQCVWVEVAKGKLVKPKWKKAKVTSGSSTWTVEPR